MLYVGGVVVALLLVLGDDGRSEATEETSQTDGLNQNQTASHTNRTNKCRCCCYDVGNKKFTLHTKKKNWHQALIYCLANNMRLATINSQEEHDQVVGQIKARNVTIKGRWWIGGSDLGRRGDFFWYSTARCFTYTKFYDGQPDNHVYENGEDEHCMELRTEWDYAWNDFVCHYYQYFVCEFYPTCSRECTCK